MKPSTDSILFHLNRLATGGAEQSSLKLMNALASRGVTVTLVLTEAGGALEAELDPAIKVFHLARDSRKSAFGRPLKRLGLAIRALALVRHKFDAAIIGMTGGPGWLVRHILRSKRRFHFIRNDLALSAKASIVIDAIRQYDKGIDTYVCVSRVAQKSLVDRVPEVRDKTIVIHNILNAEGMRGRAVGQPDPFPVQRPGGLRILSVCRLNEHHKGLRRMARVCRRLVDAGLNIDWFVMGEGRDRALLEDEIAALGIGERMHLLGSVDNPFPGYAHSDVVAMLSNYEGLCGVVNEAKVMGRAVVATRVSGVGEQLIDGETGLIVDQDEDAIYLAMKRVLTDQPLRARLTNDRLPRELLDDESKIRCFMRLVQGDARFPQYP